MSICEKFPALSISTMLDILKSSLKEKVEIGAGILPDYSIGDKVKGTAHSVSINRTGSLGAIHSHPFSSVELSEPDIIEMAKFNSQVECIGSAFTGKKEIICYTPADALEFQFFFGAKVNKLMNEIKEFTEEMKTKYKEAKPQDELEWGLARALRRRRENLSNEIRTRKEKLFDKCEVL